MNERIKELYKQAMIFSCENGGWRIITHVPEDFKEKFAELIIKECANLATKEYDNRSAIHGDDLLKHFGIK